MAHVAASLLVSLPAGHVPHEAAAARLDALAYAGPFPDREVPTGQGPARTPLDGDSRRLVAALMRGQLHSGKFSSPARGCQVAILSDRLLLVSPDDVAIVPFEDVVLVGTDRDGDIELVTSIGGVTVLNPRFFRGLAGPLATALERLPHAVRYTKDRAAAGVHADG